LKSELLSGFASVGPKAANRGTGDYNRTAFRIRRDAPDALFQATAAPCEWGRHETAAIASDHSGMLRRLIILSAVVIPGAVWFFVAPLVGLSRLASAVASRDTAALDQRVDFIRLGRSLAPQIVWAYLQKTGRTNALGRTASSLIAGASASIADPVIGALLNPEALLNFLDAAHVSSPNLTLKAGVAALPRGDFGSLWIAFQSAEYGADNFYVSLPSSASPQDQYRIRMQLLQWNWKLVAIDLPQKVREQLADELIRRIGS
jgi:hypothetical protein